MTKTILSGNRDCNHTLKWEKLFFSKIHLRFKARKTKSKKHISMEMTRSRKEIKIDSSRIGGGAGSSPSYLVARVC